MNNIKSKEVMKAQLYKRLSGVLKAAIKLRSKDGDVDQAMLDNPKINWRNCPKCARLCWSSKTGCENGNISNRLFLLVGGAVICEKCFNGEYLNK